MKRVVGLGACVLDTIISCESYPREDTKMRADSILKTGGGPVGNALVVMSKLGISAEVIGAFASDDSADFLISDFEKYGVGTSHAVRLDGTTSFVSYIAISERDGTRTCVFNRGSVPDEESNIDLSALDGAGVLHLDGNYLKSAIYAARYAKEKGVKVSLDAGGLYAGIEELLPLVDILIPSAEFALGITGCADIPSAILELHRRYSPQVLVVTAGDKGGYYYSDGEVLHYDTRKIKPVDTNGAGDTFHGAFVSAYLYGMDTRECCDFASAVASYKCEHKGARDYELDIDIALRLSGELEQRAREMSENFIKNEKQYMLGFVEAEESNPITRELGERFVLDTEDGIATLHSADCVLLPLYEKTLHSEKFDLFVKDIVKALSSGGRIIISGCGSTGRLAMRIEASFREAVREIAKSFPEAGALENSVIEVMTGGDYAIIRSVEAFEDYTSLGCEQAREMGISESDILVGVTATGETTSILGTASYALSQGARVWMIVCTDPDTLVGRLERADAVYNHENCNSIYMHTGGMAVTGSTRMQSSTIEQAVISSALELSLLELYPSKEKLDKNALVEKFSAMLDLLSEKSTVLAMKEQIELECELYNRGGHVTYFADEYLLDVLADTTERAPTFSVPHFRPQSAKGETLSWAFVKNPRLSTKEAWCSAFERVPRCIDKTPEEYKNIGIKESDIGKIPKIDLDALYAFEIGCEEDHEREMTDSLATWISLKDAPPCEFSDAAKRYRASAMVVPVSNTDGISGTRMNLFEHLAVKLMINRISTGTMAKMKRILGNYMVFISISNKKLIDRATRIVADLTSIDYERANYELFLTKLMLDKIGVEGMTAVKTIERIKKEKN